MYGLVNKAIEELITEEFGEDTWQEIVADAGVDSTGFISMDPYPDEVTYNLVGAASKILGIPSQNLLESFGEYWMKYTARNGYGALIDLSGSTFAEFLRNLDNMHARVALSFPDLKPPSFHCETGPDGRHMLSYHSDRDGLAPMIVGLLKGLAAKYEVEIAVAHVQERGVENGHDVFAIEVLNA